MRRVANPNQSMEKWYFRVNRAKRPPPWNRRPTEQEENQWQDTQSKTNENVQAPAQTIT